MKVGIIRCAQTEDICPGTMCFKVIREKKLAFEPYKDEDIEIIGYVTCGGCFREEGDTEGENND